MIGRVGSRTGFGLLVLCAALAAAGVACKGKDKGADPPAEPENPPDQVEPPQQVQESLAEIVASCSKIEGTVEIRRRGEDRWEPAAVGAVLREGDWVRTGEHSFAQVRFSKRGSIDLAEQTEVEIELAPDEEGATGVVVAVESGSVAGTLDPAADEEQPLWIETGDGGRARLRPDPEAGDEETEFRVTRERGATEVAVRKGRLRVSTDGGERGVGAGQVAEVTAAGVGDAVSMIAFPASVSPGIDARYRFQDGLRVELEWKPVDGASGYRVQVARDLSFHSLVATLETKKTSFVFAPEDAGMYTWRIASRDADGRAGEFGFVRRIFAETDPPEDLLVAPPDGERLAYSKTPPEVVFSWQTAGGATSYRLAVARGNDPTSNPVVDEVTSEQRVTVDDLAEGRYVWGVYSVGDVERPLFLRPRRLVIEQRKAPKADTKDLWD